MQFDETPLTAEPERIHQALLHEIPTWSPTYVVPLVVGFLVSVACVGGLSLGATWGLTRAMDRPFPSVVGVLVAGYLVSLLVGWLAPRPDLRRGGYRRGEKDASGCVGVLFPLLAGNLFDGLSFLARRPNLRVGDLEVATTLVTACLKHPGADRARIVKAVVKALPKSERALVEHVLDELRLRGIVQGKELLRIPPGRARDFGAVEAF